MNNGLRRLRFNLAGILFVILIGVPGLPVQAQINPQIASCAELKDDATRTQIESCSAHIGCNMVLKAQKTCANAKGFLGKLKDTLAGRRQITNNDVFEANSPALMPSPILRAQVAAVQKIVRAAAGDSANGKQDINTDTYHSYYEGGLKDGKRHGIGVAILVVTTLDGDVSMHRGQYDNFPSGQGQVVIGSMGMFVSSNYRAGRRSGSGVSQTLDGVVGAGTWDLDMHVGVWDYTYPSGNTNKVLYGADGVQLAAGPMAPPGQVAQAPTASASASKEAAPPSVAAAVGPGVAVDTPRRDIREPATAPVVPKGALPWPKIARADLSACRGEIAEFHKREIAYFREMAAAERTMAAKLNPRDTSGSAAAARNIKVYLEFAADSAKQDDFSWFMKGNDQCGGSDYPCFGAIKYDSLSHDTAEEWKRWSDLVREAAQRKPSRGPSLDDYASVADACMAKVWVAKLDAELKLASNKAPVTSRPASVAATRGGGSLSSEQIASCSEDIRRKQLESKSWTGNVNDVAARLGRFQKDLFEGRCAGHPQAQAYIAGADKMLGYGGNPAGAGGSTQGRADGGTSSGGLAPLRRDTESTEHNPSHNASTCVKIYGPDEMKARGMHGVLPSTMVNTCPYSISVTWCVAAGARGPGDCRPGFGNLTNLSGVGEKGSNAYGVDAVNQTVHYAACRYGENMGFQRVEQDPGNPFRFSCR